MTAKNTAKNTAKKPAKPAAKATTPAAFAFFVWAPPTDARANFIAARESCGSADAKAASAFVDWARTCAFYPNPVASDYVSKSDNAASIAADGRRIAQVAKACAMVGKDASVYMIDAASSLTGKRREHVCNVANYVSWQVSGKQKSAEELRDIIAKALASSIKKAEAASELRKVSDAKRATKATTPPVATSEAPKLSGLPLVRQQMDNAVFALKAAADAYPAHAIALRRIASSIEANKAEVIAMATETVAKGVAKLIKRTK